MPSALCSRPAAAAAAGPRSSTTRPPAPPLTVAGAPACPSRTRRAAQEHHQHQQVCTSIARRRGGGGAAGARGRGTLLAPAAASAGGGGGGGGAAAAGSPPRQAGVDAGYLECAQALRSLGFQNAADIARVLDTSMNPNSLFAGRGGGSGRKGANAASAREDLSAADIAAVAAFLTQRLGLSAAEVVAVVGAHPTALCYSVPDRLEPWADYLEKEVGVPDLRGALLARPSLLGLDADGSLRKIVGYLQSVGTAPEDIAAYVTKSI